MTIHRLRGRLEIADPNPSWEVVVGALVWKVLGTGAAQGADVVARKLITTGWTAATGKPPPGHPSDLQVSWPKAIGWAVASGALIGVARLLATRKAVAYYTKSARHPPRVSKRPANSLDQSLTA